MSIELTLLVIVVGVLIGLALGHYITRWIDPPKSNTGNLTLTLWIEQQEALEGIYHGIGGCNDPDHGHPIDSEENL
jgi:hypothetical protein